MGPHLPRDGRVVPQQRRRLQEVVDTQGSLLDLGVLPCEHGQGPVPAVLRVGRGEVARAVDTGGQLPGRAAVGTDLPLVARPQLPVDPRLVGGQGCGWILDGVVDDVRQPLRHPERQADPLSERRVGVDGRVARQHEHADGGLAVDGQPEHAPHEAIGVGARGSRLVDRYRDGDRGIHRPPTLRAATADASSERLPAGDGRWQLRLWWKPLVTLIWLGGGLLRHVLLLLLYFFCR